MVVWERGLMADFDVVLRGGTVLDGTGAPRRQADVALLGGVVAAVGTSDTNGAIDGSGTTEIDAGGAIVAPGFVDIHTHYDGQATWDDRMAPSAWHGVTSVVMGNCGVGFAPVHDDDHQRLIELMEGVEDIPGVALHEGLDWRWNTFPDFLQRLDGGTYDIDIAAQVPHGPIRLHVMGERGAAGEAATAADISAMAALAAAGIEAGGLGFTTSRTSNHRSSKGEPTPSLRAEADELVGIAEAIGRTDRGVLQVVSDFRDVEHEFAMLRSMVERSGRPLSLTLVQHGGDPAQWSRLLELITEANAAGHPMRGQVAPRPIGIVMGLDLTLCPFKADPVFAEIADLDLADKVAALRDPSRRDRLLESAGRPEAEVPLLTDYDRLYELGSTPNYEPDPNDCLARRAEREGVSPQTLALDLMLADDGMGMLFLPFTNFVDGNLDATREMLVHPHTVPGLSDGGAHVGTICDASFPTTLLTHWGRDRAEGRIDLELLVKAQARDTAVAVGLLDRGLIAPGYRGDVNVIDLDELTVHAPEIHHDLPAGGRRMLQRASGYRHTFCAGVETYRDGQPTEALPGRLVRGARPEPSTASTPGGSR